MSGATDSATFAEHISELRTRFMWILLFVAMGAGIGYVLNDTLMRILQKPLHDSLYYTNPGGAFSFVMKLCVVFGIVFALPILSYHIFAFFGPLISNKTKRSTVLYISMSVILAICGMLFAYFISLPASLNFLTNFGGGDIHALITANEYFNFVLAYVAGFAVLFQVPLIITFINRMTPLPPKKLIGATRYVVVFSFIIAAIITPTPDPMNQSIMAGPIIALYLLSVCIVAFQPRRLRQRKREKLAAKRAALEKKFAPIAKPLPQTALRPALSPQPVATSRPKTLRPTLEPVRAQTHPRPQQRVISDFAPVKRPVMAPQPRKVSRPIMDISIRQPRIAGA